MVLLDSNKEAVSQTLITNSLSSLLATGFEFAQLGNVYYKDMAIHVYLLVLSLLGITASLS